VGQAAARVTSCSLCRGGEWGILLSQTWGRKEIEEKKGVKEKQLDCTRPGEGTRRRYIAVKTRGRKDAEARIAWRVSASQQDIELTESA
jgi:hypothetical protein